MPRPDVDQLDEQIERIRGGGALTENEVKVLCDKVNKTTKQNTRIGVRFVFLCCTLPGGTQSSAFGLCLFNV